MNFISLLISSGLFSGFLGGVITGKQGAGGGMLGSVLGFLVQVWLLSYGFSLTACVALALITLLLGMMCVNRAEAVMLRKWGPRIRHTGEVSHHDFNETNIDEVHGQAIAGLPVFFIAGTFTEHLTLLVMSLIIFRLLDTFKPWPIYLFERLPGVWGIMHDDTMGGIMACLATTVIGLLL